MLIIGGWKEPQKRYLSNTLPVEEDRCAHLLLSTGGVMLNVGAKAPTTLAIGKTIELNYKNDNMLRADREVILGVAIINNSIGNSSHSI